MRLSRVLEDWRKQGRVMWRSRRRRFALCAFVLLLLCSLGLAGALLHQRQVADAAVDIEDAIETGEIEMEVDAGGDWQRTSAAPPPPPPIKAVQSDASRAQPVAPPRNVTAAWYDVPDDSLAKRRAGDEELTAAHNRLPIGTVVRVTNLANGKSTLVRITDRGIRDNRIKLDICREAAQELGMLSKGVARVKMEIVSEQSGAAAPESENAAPQP